MAHVNDIYTYAQVVYETTSHLDESCHMCMSHDTRMNNIYTCAQVVYETTSPSLSPKHTHTHTLCLSLTLSRSLSRALSVSLALFLPLACARSLSLCLSFSFSLFPSLSSPHPPVSLLAQDAFCFFGINSPRTNYFFTFFYGYKKLQMCH